MARTAIVTAVSTSKGVKVATPVAADVTNGNYLQNSGREQFVAKNTGGSPYNVTLTPTALVDGQSATPYVRSVPAGEEWEFGPFSVAAYGTAVAVDCSNVAITLRGSA